MFPPLIVLTTAAAPVAETVATVGSLLDQFNVWLVALAGTKVAVSGALWPRPMVAVDRLKRIPVNWTTTVTTQVACLAPSSVVTMIEAVPPETAVTNPVLEIVATAALLVDQITPRFVALLGETMAIS